MKQSLTRILMAIILAIITSVPVWAETLTGSCGTNVTYSLDSESGVLKIEGTGPIQNYSFFLGAPWYSKRHEIRQVLIGPEITGVGEYVFDSCDNIESVTINGSIESIGKCSFRSCKKLASINLPGSLKSIGEEAFNGCISLSTIDLPNSLETICARAFMDCSGLESITIPSSVTNIDNGAFSRCYFTNEKFRNNSVCTSDNNWGAKICDVIQEDGLAIIGNKVVCCRSIATTVKIPDYIKIIEGNAFRNCSQLASINIPASVDSIGEFAFRGCVSLPVIDNIRYADTYMVDAIYENESASLNIKEGTRFIGDMAFGSDGSGKNLSKVTIPNSVEKIYSYAFSYCHNLKSIIIPSSVSYIGDYAFESCGITSIAIPSSVTYIGRLAFNGCTFERKNFINNSSCTSPDNWGARIVDKTDDGLIILGTQIIGCDNQVTSVSIPNYITRIGPSAFAGCSRLTSINIPNSVTDIGSSAFSGCTGLISASLPNTITYIYTSTFEGCTSLRSLNIPNSVINIGSSAFKNCSSLTSMIIPASVKTIENYAFYNCSSLTKVQLSDGLTTINQYAFYGCKKLDSLTLPSSITTLGNNFVSDCKDLYAPLPKVVKTNVYMEGTLHVPFGAAQWFKDNGWRATSIEEDIDMDFIVASGTFDNINWKISGNTLTFTSKSGTKSPMTSYYTKLTKIGDVSSSDLANYKMYPWYEYRMKIKHVVISEDVASVGWGCLYGANNLESITTYTSKVHIDSSNYSKCFLEIFGRSFDKTGRFLGTAQSAFYDLEVPKTLSKIVYKGSDFGISYFSGEEARIIRSSSDGYGEWLRYNEYHPTNPLEIYADNVTEYDSYNTRMALKNTKLYLTYTGEVRQQIFNELADLYSLTINTTGVPTMSGAFYSLFGNAVNNREMMYGGGGYYIPLNLKEVHLMEGVTSIPEACFNNVTSLERVYLPSTLRGVQDKAFRNCDGLTDIYVNAAMPPSAKDDSFDGVNIFLCTLHVPYDSKQYYSIARGWRDFYTIDNNADVRLTIVKNIENAGQIIGTTSYLNGELTDITAVPNEGYRFVEWVDDAGNSISKNNKLAVEATSSCVYYAIFTSVSNFSNVRITIEGADAELIWAPLDGVEYYRVQIFEDSELTRIAKEVTVDAQGNVFTRGISDLSVSISDLDSNTAYYYRILSYNQDGVILDEYSGSFVTSDPDGVEDVSSTEDEVIGIYNVRGEQIDHLAKGINIIRTKNGVVKKVLVK